MISEHLIYIKGVELLYHEYKELLLELALRMKEKIDSAPGKLRALVRKFLDDHFLKRLQPYIKFTTEKKESKDQAQSASRAWPESEKDEAIKVVMEERRKQEEEAQRIREEEAARQAEIEAKERAEREAAEAQK